MARATGLGGIFLRARDPQALYAWYEHHLGLPRLHDSSESTFILPAASQRASLTVAFFPQQAEYFPLTQPAMLNFQVDDLDALLDRLLEAGVSVDPKRESCEFGRFGWFTDPEGNRVELWQPAPGEPLTEPEPPES